MTAYGLPPAVDSWSGDLATVAAIVVSLGVLLHRRSPLRKIISWLFHRNVGEPVVAAFEAVVERVVDRKVTPQIRRLDGKVEELAILNDAQHAETADSIKELQTALGEHILANPGFPNVPPGPPRPRYGR